MLTDTELTAALWRIAAPALVIGWAAITALAVYGSLISWGWL